MPQSRTVRSIRERPPREKRACRRDLRPLSGWAGGATVAVVAGPRRCGGGLVGDIQDAARFLSVHLGGGAVGGQRLLSAGSAAAMRTLTIRGTKLTTGLGWWRRYEADDGSGLVEHLGGGGAYRNLMRLYPNTGRAVVMFGNLTSYPIEQLTAAVLTSGTGPPWHPAATQPRT
jgi:CubicO group peptidase (beta-lactamase class C family)